MTLFITTLAQSSPAHASDAIHDGISAELTRAITELKLPELPGPYHVASLVYDTQTFSVSATLGGVTSRSNNPYRSAGFIVRSGSTALDNTNFDASRTGIGSTSLVHSDDVLAIRKDAWWRLDQLYKQSVEALAAKEAAMARRAEPDDVPDFAPGAPAQAAADPAAPFETAPLEALAVELSALFLTRPEIEWSLVTISGTTGRRLMIDTGGTDVIEPLSVLTLRVMARVRADDGAPAIDHVTHIVRDPSQLPSREKLTEQVSALAERLVRWRTLPLFEEEYVGPVLLIDNAAVDVAQRVAAPSLFGTPEEMKPPLGSRIFSFDESGAGPGALQLKRRLLPPGFTVIDDPERDKTLPSSYRYDSEGVRAQKVELVTDGIVRTHLMSRIPSETLPASNGHGRAAPGSLVRAMPADFTITAKKTSTDKALHKAAIKLAADYGSPHYARIERIRDPALRPYGGGPRVVFGEETSAFPPPLEVVFVRKDGSESRYRGAELSGLDARALKEIVGSGESTRQTRLWSDNSRNGGVVVTMAAPDWLFGELVLSPSHEDAEKPPVLASPLHGRAAARP